MQGKKREKGIMKTQCSLQPDIALQCRLSKCCTDWLISVLVHISFETHAICVAGIAQNIVK